MAPALLPDFDLQLAKKGAIFHDLGKAHPIFQARMQAINANSLVEAEKQKSIKHRHELSSLAFLSLLAEEERQPVIDLVVAHHKSIENDPRGRGILDLVEEDKNFIKIHLQDWDEWSQYGLLLLEKFDIPTRTISYKEAQESIDYAVAHCSKKGPGWSPLRGLLKCADHFASAFNEKTADQLRKLFQVPDTSFYHQDSRRSSLYPLSQISTDSERPHTMVVAPTGAGKTDFLLRRCRGRIFYTLPFQASINAMYERMRTTIVPAHNVRVLHSTSKIIAKGGDEQILQPLVGASAKVLTPHQLSAIIFGTGGFESVMLDLQGADVILDEVHCYTDLSRAMVLEIVNALLRLNCRLHIGTATMPTILYRQILSLLSPDQTYEIKLPNNVLDTFDRHIVHKIDDVSTITSLLKQAIINREKVLMVYNTVKRAQQAFVELKSMFPNIHIMLIHSRFRRMDRVRLEKELIDAYNGHSENSGYAPCIVISTQVVEVSLDISFDRMVTECAPLDGLIQRFGRVNRRRTLQSVQNRLLKSVHVLRPEGSCLPYNGDVVRRSFAQLDDGHILKEQSLQNKIDAVYPELDTREIDTHLIYVDGKYRIKELTNHKKSILVDALEIESATCILECNRKAYETSNWESRLNMEIPINWKSFAPYANKYPQLEIGAYPFVIPQDEQEHRLIGLVMVEPDNII